MSVGMPGPQSLTIEDLPRLIAAVVEAEPDRTALVHADAEVTYERLHSELTTLDSAMGGALGPDALVPVVISTLLPELLATREGGLESVVGALIADATSVVAFEAPSVVESTLVSLFEEQVARTPDAVALRFGSTASTYAEFDRRVNQLARELRRPWRRTGHSSAWVSVGPSNCWLRCTRSSRPVVRTYHSIPTIPLSVWRM